MKLKKILNVLFFVDPVKQFYSSKEAQDLAILLRYLDQYFPQKISPNTVLYGLNSHNHTKLQDKDVYADEFLPLHTRDNAWLMKRVYKIVRKNEKDYNINPKSVQNFVAHNREFKAKRNQYEQQFTAAQTEYMFNKPVANAFMDQNTSPYFNKNLPNYDSLFRQEVIRSMSKMGFDPHNVELSLEKHARLWRKQAMIISFENTYYPLADLIDMHGEFDEWWQRLAKFKQKHQEVWLKRREYYYYREHKDVIDEAGCVNENMRMNIKELTMVNSKLARMEKHLQRMIKRREKRATMKPLNGLKKTDTKEL